MKPEEMIYTLNKYIQKAKDDVSEAKSRHSRLNKSANNASNNDDFKRHSDIMGQNKSDNTNVYKTEVLNHDEDEWDGTINDKSAKSALTSQWTYVDKTVTNKSHLGPVNSKMCSIYAEPESFDKLNLRGVDKT